MFLQGNFAPPPVNTQPPANFVPSNPPLLRNAEQYQQPSTLGSQLYPVCNPFPTPFPFLISFPPVKLTSNLSLH